MFLEGGANFHLAHRKILACYGPVLNLLSFSFLLQPKMKIVDQKVKKDCLKRKKESGWGFTKLLTQILNIFRNFGP